MIDNQSRSNKTHRSPPVDSSVLHVFHFDPSVQNGACAHYVMVSTFQWKPFWLATQRDPQNDWTATPNRVNYDVFAQAPLWKSVDIELIN